MPQIFRDSLMVRNNDRRRGCPGRIRGGGEHLGAGVESIALRAGRSEKRALGAAAEGAAN